MHLLHGLPGMDPIGGKDRSMHPKCVTCDRRANRSTSSESHSEAQNPSVRASTDCRTNTVEISTVKRRRSNAMVRSQPMRQFDVRKLNRQHLALEVDCLVACKDQTGIRMAFQIVDLGCKLSGMPIIV